ncbi:unnamed protein product [Meloidogyne enterolobii]|uniref:Uncharacterized protein n=1 Tax=Meloidogyne enterolobii TaxID=390850 RepID=A0ACB0Y595_MELEN
MNKFLINLRVRVILNLIKYVWTSDIIIYFTVNNKNVQLIKTLLLYMNFYVEAYNINKESLISLPWLKNVIIKIGAEINLLSINSPGRKILIDIVKKEWSDGKVKMYLYKNLKNGITEYDRIYDSISLGYSESEKSVKHKQVEI